MKELIDKITGVIDSENVMKMCFKEGRVFNLETIPTHAILTIDTPDFGKKFISLTKEEFNEMLLSFNILSGHKNGYVKEKIVTSKNDNTYKVTLTIVKSATKNRNGQPDIAYKIHIKMEVAENNSWKFLGYNQCFFYQKTFENLMLTAGSNLNNPLKINKITQILDEYKKD